LRQLFLQRWTAKARLCLPPALPPKGRSEGGGKAASFTERPKGVAAPLQTLLHCPWAAWRWQLNLPIAAAQGGETGKALAQASGAALHPLPWGP
jgi:hypothetical protein